MGKLLSLLLLLPLSSFSQKLRDSVKVKTPIYEVVYSEKLEQPTWIQYMVQCPDGNASRAGMDFYTNDSIKTSDNEDYVKNLYDKGHLAPAADFNCTKELLYQTLVFDKKSIKLPSGATVPNGFYKTIRLEKSKKTIKYYFPNETPAKPKYTDYAIK